MVEGATECQTGPGVDRVRGREERRRVALQGRFGTPQPTLTETGTLMEANIEEPLSTDEIAQLAGGVAAAAGAAVQAIPR